ncbi:MAG TPA: STM3941 family protein [Steroidobacteraceae bacterium]|nr:STM3941 family protein [Steroidobacteraceae bacterium]
MSVPLPLPAVLKPRKRRLVWLLVGCAAFVAMSCFVLRKNEPAGYAGMAFFGLGVLVAGVSLLPGSAFLQVTHEGFTYCSLYRRHHTAWHDVKEFRPIIVGTKAMVGWNYNAVANHHLRLRRVSAAIAGVEAALPDTYGMTASDLATLLNDLLQRNRPDL